MDRVFKALADATRRELLDRLYERPGQTLTELIADLGMRRQSATKHLAILESAELVSTRWRGREKLHYLNPLPIAEIGRRWIDRFSEPRAEALLNLKQALEENEDE
ncbi:MAG: helix-turn-helix transcriptional regulator [bacterium]|nr:helix-turn-helix transcriptional regulator [bacterium]